MKDKLWQDETVQELKRGYEEIIATLKHELSMTAERQSAEIARLREALKPFAEAGKRIDESGLSKDWRDSKKITVGVMVDDDITVGDLRRAARALEGGTK